MYKEEIINKMKGLSPKILKHPSFNEWIDRISKINDLTFWNYKKEDWTSFGLYDSNINIIVSKDGKTLEYNISADNKTAQANGCIKQFSIISHKWSVDENGYVIHSEGSGNYNDVEEYIYTMKKENKPSLNKTPITYTCICYDENGNEIAYYYINKNTSYDKLLTFDVFKGEVTTFQRPTFELMSYDELYAKGISRDNINPYHKSIDADAVSIKRNMEHPSALFFSKGEVRGTSLIVKYGRAISLDQIKSRIPGNMVFSAVNDNSIYDKEGHYNKMQPKEFIEQATIFEEEQKKYK